MNYTCPKCRDYCQSDVPAPVCSDCGCAMELAPSDDWDRGFYQGYMERAQDPNLILALIHAERCAYDAPVPWNNSFLSILQDLRSFTGAVGMPQKMQRAVDRAREIQMGTRAAWAEAFVSTFEEALQARDRVQAESTDETEREEAQAAYFFARQFLTDALAATPAPAVAQDDARAVEAEPTFPPLPASVLRYPLIGTVYDRMAMHQYALQCHDTWTATRPTAAPSAPLEAGKGGDDVRILVDRDELEEVEETMAMQGLHDEPSFQWLHATLYPAARTAAEPESKG